MRTELQAAGIDPPSPGVQQKSVISFFLSRCCKIEAWGTRKQFWSSSISKGGGPTLRRRAAKCSGQIMAPNAHSPSFTTRLASPGRSRSAAPGEFTLAIDPDEMHFLSPLPCNALCERRSHAAVQLGHRGTHLSSCEMSRFSLWIYFLLTVWLIVLLSFCLDLFKIGM